MEAARVWVFVVNPRGLSRSIYIFKILFLKMLPADTVETSYASIKKEFMWRGKNFVVPYFIIHAAFDTF